MGGATTARLRNHHSQLYMLSCQGRKCSMVSCFGSAHGGHGGVMYCRKHLAETAWSQPALARGAKSDSSLAPSLHTQRLKLNARFARADCQRRVRPPGTSRGKPKQTGTSFEEFLRGLPPIPGGRRGSSWKSRASDSSSIPGHSIESSRAQACERTHQSPCTACRCVSTRHWSYHGPSPGSNWEGVQVTARGQTPDRLTEDQKGRIASAIGCPVGP